MKRFTKPETFQTFQSVSKMPRQNKVLTSPHFNEIHERLCRGESGRSVSEWLEKTYNENISFAAMNRYKKNYIKMEEKVEVEANKILAEETTEVIVQENVDKKVNAEIETRTVATEIGEVLIGMTKVAKNFPDDYEDMKKAAKNPDSPVTEKDVAQMSYNAGKTIEDYSKSQDTNVEVNVNSLTASFNKDKIRSILDAKRGANARRD